MKSLCVLCIFAFIVACIPVAAQEQPIGIIGPMEEEIVFIKEKMKITGTKKVAGMRFYMGTLHGKKVVLVSSGIGKVNAATCAQVLIDHFHVRTLINEGIAAALADKYQPGDIILSVDTVQHDVDGTGIGEEPGAIPRMNMKYFIAEKLLLQFAEQAGKEMEDTHVYTGRIASGDQFIASESFKLRIRNQFQAAAVEMEGGAIGHVAYLNNVPFLVIRAIADDGTGVEAAEYDKLIVMASKQAAEMVDLLIKEIK
ncbi:5'-methylthioadenosine/adenosylhomocysteine nucleosidase [Ectobacillus sp. JY-23]|uniref:5'-methylthioadenosine/adenosylhomocysteine nucleosidase n=1 Tax=Ectobacillus sp. JY-23 TaxID=2933872 RepID=UPI001FF3F025|nr:5'-methylthioadenosine/adenosylhomocysteine nucleosidase [Ectobacillus sp. JY-23]UOY91105.1 5'-methylthioadenosine/adenosylhomocysteine nucleosidase [Ectobacillus sp. JY-23]